MLVARHDDNDDDDILFVWDYFAGKFFECIRAHLLAHK